MLRKIIKRTINALGYEIVPIIPPDMDGLFLSVYRDCKDFTVTSIERMYSLYKATRYIVENEVAGDVVECGVWKGGSMMLCATTLKMLGDISRKLYLYDTYAGMTDPTSRDIDYKGNMAVKSDFNKWCSIPLEDVQKVMYSTKYPIENLLFVVGKVEDTIPKTIPEKIALLRLDTDFYESTYHELVYLFPRLVQGGVLIIDDYGHFKGAREAVDKYIKENNVKILLNRIDYTGRIGIRQV